MELPVGDKGPEVKDNWVKFITQGGLLDRRLSYMHL